MPTILHADGDRELREIYRCFFTCRGYRFLTADGGLACLEKLQECSPDLLILDLELPWGGGDGVLAVMREEARLLKTSVVVTSTLASAGVLNDYLSPPVVGVLAKPVTLSALIALIACIDSADCLRLV